MPTWGEILTEIHATGDPKKGVALDFDGVRRKYLAQLQEKLGDRAVIIYYSAWLEPGRAALALDIDLLDTQAMMEVVSNIKEKKLDLFIHSPGGSVDGAEAVLTYLRTRFEEIRAVVPLAAMSAGTMLAMGCDEIIMGAHSQLGPIDPQFHIMTMDGPRSAPAEAILEQFERAKREIEENPATAGAWLPILSGYGPGLLVACVDQRELGKQLVSDWLTKYMLKDSPDAAATGASIAAWLTDYQHHKTHARPIHRDELRERGVRVIDLEDDDELQDAVLSVHHAALHTLAGTATAKLVENHHGRAFVRTVQVGGGGPLRPGEESPQTPPVGPAGGGPGTSSPKPRRKRKR